MTSHPEITQNLNCPKENQLANVASTLYRPRIDESITNTFCQFKWIIDIILRHRYWPEKFHGVSCQRNNARQKKILHFIYINDLEHYISTLHAT